MSLAENIRAAREKIAAAAREVGRDPAEITLSAATKVQTDETIRAAIAAGIAVCGENRVQEMTAHLEHDTYAGARLHFIGHLQTNKVRQVVGRVDLIESVDSPHLLEAVDKQAAKLGLVQDILLEVNVGGEQSKSGVLPEQVRNLSKKAQTLSNARLRGLMAIPPAPGEEGNRKFFREMWQIFVDIRGEIADNNGVFDCLSMGMSGDYEDAVREGATLVRLGTALFGPRPPIRKGP